MRSGRLARWLGALTAVLIAAGATWAASSYNHGVLTSEVGSKPVPIGLDNGDGTFDTITAADPLPVTGTITVEDGVLSGSVAVARTTVASGHATYAIDPGADIGRAVVCSTADTNVRINSTGATKRYVPAWTCLDTGQRARFRTFWIDTDTDSVAATIWVPVTWPVS